MQVSHASSISELRALLGHLEEAVQDKWLSPLFQRQPLLVKGAWLLTGLQLPPHCQLPLCAVKIPCCPCPLKIPRRTNQPPCASIQLLDTPGASHKPVLIRGCLGLLKVESGTSACLPHSL